MRSRPDLVLHLDPPRPLPGESFVARVLVRSRSDTPCEGIELRLLGRERRYVRTDHHGSGDNQTSHDIYDERIVVSLAARIDVRTLPRGDHHHAVRFELPPDAPPSYASPLSRIEYELDVRVAIPWWPDRHEQYVVPVAVRPHRLPPPTPRTYCSRQGGPKGTELYGELALARSELLPGEVLEGAFSLANVEHHRVRKVVLALVATETPRVESAVGPREIETLEATLFDGKPGDRASLPVRLRVPKEAMPTFVGTYARLDWALAVKAIVTLGSDFEMRVPIVVAPPASTSSAATTPEAHRVSPIGRERQQLVWKAIGDRHGMTVDEDHMHLRGGWLGDASLTVSLEPHGDQGLWTVARLAWPTLGLELRVTERRWFHALTRGEIDLGDRAFGERFATTARERAQAEAMLSPEVRQALLAFEGVAVDDGGCMLGAPGSAFSVEELSPFVTRVLEAARRLIRARTNVPPPSSMAAHLDAWRSFAAEVGGRFEIGRLFVHDATIDGERFDAGTVYAGPTPDATLVRLQLPAGERAEGRVEPSLAPLAALGHAITVDDRGVVVHVRPRVEDPRSLRPVLAALVELARAARGEAVRGPYR
jgi:hypothetical protein